MTSHTEPPERPEHDAGADQDARPNGYVPPAAEDIDPSNDRAETVPGGIGNPGVSGAEESTRWH